MVKPGYKQTEIGVIPEDWEVKSLNEIAPLQRGFDLPYSQMEEGKYPVVFSNGVGAFHNAYMAKGPGVITGRSGTIGKVHYISTNYWPHNTTLWVTDFHGNDEKYVYYLFQTVPWELFNSGSSVPTLNRNDVHDTLHAIPPRPERRRIAEALSDMDELIASMEKLIAKKKAIKQGTMQELLTGKRRLPGFSGEWNAVELRKLGRFVGGGTPSTNNLDWWKGKTPWISSSDLEENQIRTIKMSRHITEEAIAHSATNLCPAGAILVVSRVGVGKVAVAPVDLCTSQDFTNIIVNNCNPCFLAYTLSIVMKEKAATTQGTSIKGVTSDEIAAIKVRIPSRLEQDAIANALESIDQDIGSIEKQYLKSRQIKHGMRQQLLTGKIRLV